MVLLESAAIYLFMALMSIALQLTAYATVIVSLAQCKSKRTSAKKELQSPNENELKKNIASEQCVKPNPSETISKSPNIKNIGENKSRKQQIEKTKKDTEADEEEERQIVEDIRPKRIARNAKEERIAKGKEMRGKGDYPTMDDVLSDWDSEKDGKKRTAKPSEDQETRTNLEDADDERPSKSTIDQTKKPESQLEEPVEKNNNEIRITKEITTEKSLVEKDTQMDDEGKDTQRIEGGSGKFDETKLAKRLVKVAKEKCESKLMIKQKDSSDELEVCMTQMSPIRKRSNRSLRSSKRKASSNGNLLEKSEQQSRKKNKISFSVLECATQQTKRSTREGAKERRSVNEWSNKVMDTVPIDLQKELLVTAVEKATEKSINDGSKKCANSRTSHSKIESSEREDSAKDNRDNENKEASKEDEETPKQSGADIVSGADMATGENVLSACSSERRKNPLHTASGSDIYFRTSNTTDGKMVDQEIKPAKDDATQVADNDDF